MSTAVSSVAAVAPVCEALVDLKRVRVAGRRGSVAERLFAGAWAALVAGRSAGSVALDVAGRAVGASVLSGVEDADLDALPPARRAALRARAVTEGAAGPGLTRAREALLAHEPAGSGAERPIAQARVPGFVAQLCAQPRAGATAPGRRRIVLHPPESHGDHCLAVAVGATLLALEDGLDPGRPFLAGLAHHLQNATFPDAGFAGEELLGDDLDTLFTCHRERALHQLDDELRAATLDALPLADDVESAEGRAVVAADTLDRVLELEWHARSARFTLDVALDDLELVHPGPLQALGEATLREAGLR